MSAKGLKLKGNFLQDWSMFEKGRLSILMLYGLLDSHSNRINLALTTRFALRLPLVTLQRLPIPIAF